MTYDLLPCFTYRISGICWILRLQWQQPVQNSFVKLVTVQGKSNEFILIIITETQSVHTSVTQPEHPTNILISCSKSKSGREKRSQRETYFQPSDIVIPGISSVGENTLKVEFVVLFPAVNGRAPQPSLPAEITQMLQERKETIENAVGGTIKQPNVKPSKK